MPPHHLRHAVRIDRRNRQAIVGTSVEVLTTSSGPKYGAWRAIDLDSPP